MATLDAPSNNLRSATNGRVKCLRRANATQHAVLQFRRVFAL